MFNTKVGNCYGFASSFAALAKEVGYKKIELIDGRTPGTRDHAPDGFTGHCWIRIDNKYYDPEADWAGWMTGVYGHNSYPIRHYIKKFTILINKYINEGTERVLLLDHKSESGTLFMIQTGHSSVKRAIRQ